MTSDDLNHLMPAQEKLEWVTPKISLMDGRDTAGSGKPNTAAETPAGSPNINGNFTSGAGPS